MDRFYRQKIPFLRVRETHSYAFKTPKFPILKTYSNQVRGNGVQTNMVRSVYSRYFKPDFKLEKYSTSNNQ